MRNFKDETLAILADNGKTADDIRWVGFEALWCKGGGMTAEEFLETSSFVYDNNVRNTVIALDLLVVGDDWWLERYRDDLFEGWKFKSIPIKPLEKLERINQWTYVGQAYEGIK